MVGLREMGYRALVLELCRLEDDIKAAEARCRFPVQDLTPVPAGATLAQLVDRRHQIVRELRRRRQERLVVTSGRRTAGEASLS